MNGLHVSSLVPGTGRDTPTAEEGAGVGRFIGVKWNAGRGKQGG